MKYLVRKITPAPVRKFLTRLGKFYGKAGGQGNPYGFPSQEGAFHTLKELGWAPHHCIDVGAYHGNWARLFLSIFSDSTVLMIEAQESKREILRHAVSAKENNLEFEIALLGASDGIEVPFVEMSTGSSVYEESSPYNRSQTTKKLVRLDSLLEKYPKFMSSNVLKIDVQGYELEVLKGCPNLLNKLEVVLLEVSLVGINKGAPLFSEVVLFMSSKGFKLFDFCSQIRRKDGVLWQADLLWIRDNEAINIPTELTKGNWG